MTSLLNKFAGGAKLPENDEPHLPPTKRISTPAGQRLSTILEYNQGASKHNRNSFLTTGRKTPLPDFKEEDSTGGSACTTSVWSEGADRVERLKSNRHLSKRGGWRRFALILLVLLIIIIALVVGLVVGLKKEKPSDQTSAELANNDPQNPASTLVPAATPDNFPRGSYSFATFLDTSITDCTSNAATWTCFPYATFYDAPSKSAAVFNWIINEKSGGYQISSTNNPFSINFSNSDLTLEDEGQDNERYTFRMIMDKTVSPSDSITDDNAAVTCFFNQTTFQAYLYTRQPKTYPKDGEEVVGTSYPLWPFRVRIEQVASGGENVPNCYKLNNGAIGNRVTEGLNASDPSALCSCLYKNWQTPVG